MSDKRDDMMTEIRKMLDDSLHLVRGNLQRTQQGMVAQGRELAALAARVAIVEARGLVMPPPGWADVAEATAEGPIVHQPDEDAEPESLRWLDGEPYCPALAERVREALGLPETHAEGLSGLVERLLTEHEQERERAERERAEMYETRKARKALKRCSRALTAMTAERDAEREENLRLRVAISEAEGALLVERQAHEKASGELATLSRSCHTPSVFASARSLSRSCSASSRSTSPVRPSAWVSGSPSASRTRSDSAGQ